MSSSSNTHIQTHTVVLCMSRDMKHSAPEEWVIDPSALGEAIFPSVRTGPESNAAPSCEKGRGQKRGDCSGQFEVTVKERRSGLSGFNSRTSDRLCHCCGRRLQAQHRDEERKLLPPGRREVASASLPTSLQSAVAPGFISSSLEPRFPAEGESTR